MMKLVLKSGYLGGLIFMLIALHSFNRDKISAAIFLGVALLYVGITYTTEKLSDLYAEIAEEMEEEEKENELQR